MHGGIQQRYIIIIMEIMSVIVGEIFFYRHI